MRTIVSIAASVLAFLAVPANAATTISWNPGSNALGSNQVIFESFDVLGPVGTRSEVRNSSNLRAIRPTGSTGGFLAAGYGSTLRNPGGSYSLDLPSAAPIVSFLLGSLGVTNQVVLTYANGNTTQFDGFQIIGNPGQFLPIRALGSNGRVSYNVGSTDPNDFIRNITFSSTLPSFEIDDVASAAPEPATWLMMILGFGLVGAALRRRRGMDNLAAA